MKRFIPVAEPALVGNEKTYVLDCLDSTWISSSGEYIQRFESAFADFCGARHAVSCCNGTVALHLALLALGVVPGDEVLIPTLTFVATANAVAYCGARPVLVDSEPETWNMNPQLIRKHITPDEGNYPCSFVRAPDGHGPGAGDSTRTQLVRSRGRG